MKSAGYKNQNGKVQAKWTKIMKSAGYKKQNGKVQAVWTKIMKSAGYKNQNWQVKAKKKKCRLKGQVQAETTVFDKCWFEIDPKKSAGSRCR